ncbi:MAG: gamma-glutamylcyclotransferase family protein, partial [Luteolibacter sp.]
MNSGQDTLIFVYGTLRRGGCNHHRLDEASFVARATLPGRLYRIDWYPGMVADANAGEVVGEIYQIDTSMLASLDDYEGPEYQREIMNLRILPDLDADSSKHPSQHATAWVWLWQEP